MPPLTKTKPPVITPGWITAVTIGSLVVLAGFVQFVLRDSPNAALGYTVLGGVLIGAGGEVAAYWPADGPSPRRRRGAVLLVALLLMPAMAALTPFAFRTHPGDYSIFGVIPLLAALTGGAALVGDWLGRRILNGAVDTAWPRQRRRTTRRFSTGGFLLVTISVLVLAAYVCLFASLSFTGHPPRRASPYLFYAEFWGIDLESVTIVHPVLLWVSRGLAVCAAALVVVIVRRRRVRMRTLAHEHHSKTAKR